MSCEDKKAVRFGFKKRTIKLLDKNRHGPGIHQKTLRLEESKTRDASAVKRKLTVPVSPRLHLKDRALNRDADLNKTMHQDRSFASRVLQAPAALAKFSTQFRAKSIARRQFLAGQAAGLRKVKEQRQNTKFKEFDLSYKRALSSLSRKSLLFRT